MRENIIIEPFRFQLSEREKNELVTNCDRLVSLKHSSVNPFAAAHDRFLIIDKTELYHFGASLKYLGKKWFDFSKMNAKTPEMLNLLKKIDE